VLRPDRHAGQRPRIFVGDDTCDVARVELGLSRASVTAASVLRGSDLEVPA